MNNGRPPPLPLPLGAAPPTVNLTTNFNVTSDKKAAVWTVVLGPMQTALSFDLDSWERIAQGILAAVREAKDQKVILADLKGRLT